MPRLCKCRERKKDDEHYCFGKFVNRYRDTKYSRIQELVLWVYDKRYMSYQKFIGVSRCFFFQMQFCSVYFMTSYKDRQVNV